MQWYWWVLILVLVLAIAGAAFAAWWFLFRVKSPPPIGKKFEVWYGRVNAWAHDKRRLEKDVKACRKAGVKGYHIELMGWARYDAWTPDWLKDTEEMYNYLLKLCRKNGLRLFVSIVNDNMGSGKYGDPKVPLSRVLPQAMELIEIVKRGGPDNVVVQPVGETQSSAGPGFEQACLQRLGGKFVLVYNGSGGRPGGVPGGFAYRAWHPFKVTDKIPGDAIAVSDTGMIIAQLGVGLDGPAKPGVLEEWAKQVRAQGCPVCCYYAFKFDGHDKAGIEALGRAAK